jgi:ABC-2 type transport system ATP-binding protein/heme-transporting ATPase
MNISGRNLSLTLGNVTKYYHEVCIFKNLSFSLGVGVYPLIGENGVGKSTLMRICSGLETVHSGQVQINSLDVFKNRNPVNLVRSYVPDKPEFYEHVTVRELLLLALGIRKKMGRSEVDEIIAMWDLEPLLERRFHQLSFGQKKRVFFSFNLLDSLSVWILDEPFNGLDQKWQENLSRVLKKAGENKIVVASIHEPSHLTEFSSTRIRLFREDHASWVSCQVEG